jgi:L-threonylcarbamoyladenylate synthase
LEKYQTEIISATEEGLLKAKKLLLSGKLVAVPTETVYGLAGIAEKNSALLEIFRVKGRPQTNPLIIHTHSGYKTALDLHSDRIIDLNNLSSEAIITTNKLMEIFWPGPLTLIFPKGKRISSIATAEGTTVAVRQSSHPIFQNLLRMLDKPLAAPSANRSNRISPTSAQDVFEELNSKIPLIIDGGDCDIGLESTVLQVLNSGELKVLRSGGLSIDVLTQKGFRCLTPQLKQPSNLENMPLLSPGQLSVHYAPKKPIFMIDMNDISPSDLNIFLMKRTQIQTDSSIKLATIRFQTQFDPWWKEVISQYPLFSWLHFDISMKDNSQVTARELFARMRNADKSPAHLILVEQPLLFGDLWPAILDRLTRACGK